MWARSARIAERSFVTIDDATGGAPLAVVFGTLDRVLGAHIAHDPMVDELPGASASSAARLRAGSRYRGRLFAVHR